MPIHTIIVDNDVSCINKLCKDLAEYADVKILAAIASPEKAKKIILKQQPDLVFLGVEMPEMNRTELLREIRSFTHSNMCVVFYSAFDNCLLDALRASAFDYLSKSYKIEELKKIIERIRMKTQESRINFEQSMRRLLADNQKFALHTLTSLLFLHRSEILYFQYFNNARYWQMTLVSMTTHKLRLSTTAKDILNISAAFIQVSQNCILNMDHLASIENKTLSCTLYPPFDHLNIYASRRYYSKIKEVLEIL